MTTTLETTGPALLEALGRARTVIESYRDKAEDERRLPAPVIDSLKAEGLFGLLLPRELGGAEAALPDYLALIEAMSAVDGATGWVFTNIATGACQAAFLPAAGMKEVFGDHPLTVGSVIPRGRAVPVAGGYRLSGQWPLVSGRHHAAWFGGNALVFDGDAPRMGPGGMPGFTIMYVPADEAAILDTWHSTGLRGTGSVDVVVKDAFVPEQRTFALFTTPPQTAGGVFRLGIDVLFLTSLPAVGLGIARAAIDAFVELARGKTPTLSQTALGARPTVHAEVAKAEATWQSARAYLHETAREMMAAVAGAEHLPPELEAKRRLAAMNVARSSEEVVDSMYRLAGASAVYSSHRLDRCLRDVHTANQHLATSPVWWEKTGQSYFGQGLGMP